MLVGHLVLDREGNPFCDKGSVLIVPMHSILSEHATRVRTLPVYAPVTLETFFESMVAAPFLCDIRHLTLETDRDMLRMVTDLIAYFNPSIAERGHIVMWPDVTVGSSNELWARQAISNFLTTAGRFRLTPEEDGSRVPWPSSVEVPAPANTGEPLFVLSCTGRILVDRGARVLAASRPQDLIRVIPARFIPVVTTTTLNAPRSAPQLRGRHASYCVIRGPEIQSLDDDPYLCTGFSWSVIRESEADSFVARMCYDNRGWAAEYLRGALDRHNRLHSLNVVRQYLKTHDLETPEDRKKITPVLDLRSRLVRRRR